MAHRNHKCSFPSDNALQLKSRGAYLHLNQLGLLFSTQRMHTTENCKASKSGDIRKDTQDVGFGWMILGKTRFWSGLDAIKK
jgi:hypothetical protein